MFSLGLKRKTAEVEVQGKLITLFEPSALARTIHLEEVMERGEVQGEVSIDKMAGSEVLKMKRQDTEYGLKVIAMCLYANPEYESHTEAELYEGLKRELDDESINKLYEAAASLTYPKPPEVEDKVDPKPAQAGDSGTT